MDSASTSSPCRPLQLWGYVPDYDVDAAYASALSNAERLTGFTVVRYGLDEAGGLIESSGFRPVPEWVGQWRLPVVSLVANQVAGEWSADLVSRLLGDPVLRRRHVEEIVARTAGDAGVEIDYEALPTRARASFSLFIEELGEALHRRGKQLAVALHAKLAEPGEGDGPAGQDWSRIGASADRVAVMTYDYDPTCPGPISPVTWVRDVLRFAVSQMPAAKVIQGVPLYGYHWVNGQAPAYVTHRDLQALAHEHGVSPRRDPTDRHMVLDLRVGGAHHEVWIPDMTTAVTLAQIGRRVGVAGYAVWRLGGEDPSALRGLAASLLAGQDRPG